MKLKDILPEQVSQLLTEDSLKTIQNALNSKIKLNVEAALIKQDEIYAERLQELIEARDIDCAKKFKRALTLKESVATTKLRNVINKYTSDLNENASEFKDVVVDQISSYLDEFIDEAIPTAAIMEATKNRTATEVLSNLRDVLAVDSALMSESVKEAVIEGKTEIDKLRSQVSKLTAQKQTILESYSNTKTALLLEQKTSHLSKDKRDYMYRVLSDKTPKFINENFEYTLRLFNRDEKKELKVLKEQAYKTRTVRADAVKTPRISASNKKETAIYLEGFK